MHLRVHTLLAPIFLVCALLAPASAQAQSSRTPPPIREIGALSLVSETPPPLFFQRTDGTYAPFRIGGDQGKAVNEVPILAPSLRLYRQSRDAAGNTIATPAMELPLPAGQTPLILVFHYDSSGRVTYRLLDELPSHEAHTVRLTNLSTSEVVCKLDDSVFTLSPGSSLVRKVSDPGRFLFAYGVQGAQGDIYKSTTRRRRFPIDDMRLHVVFSNVHKNVAEDGNTHRLLLVRDVNVFERIIKPEHPEPTRLARR